MVFIYPSAALIITATSRLSKYPLLSLSYFLNKQSTARCKCYDDVFCKFAFFYVDIGYPIEFISYEQHAALPIILSNFIIFIQL